MHNAMVDAASVTLSVKNEGTIFWVIRDLNQNSIYQKRKVFIP